MTDDEYRLTGEGAARRFGRGSRRRRANLKMCGTPINISSGGLKIGYEELLAAFEAYFKG